MALDGADPALGRAEHGHRLALDQRLDRHQDRRRRLADLGAAPAERGSRAELLARLGDLLADRPPLPAILREQRGQLALLLLERRQLLADLDFLELAQGAQAQVEDRLRLQLAQIPARHELRLRLVALADDADHLVDVEIDDDLALEDLHAPRDRREAVAGAALQHDAAVIEEGLQRLLQIHDARHAGGVEDVEVERNARLELARAEQRLHQHRRIDVARFRLEDEA